MANKDLALLTEYFMKTNNIPNDVRQAFVNVKKQMESIQKKEEKINDDEGMKTVKKETGILSRDVLISNKWLFYNDREYLGEMEFAENNIIKGYTSSNERTWKLSQHAYGHSCLEFYGDGNKKTCTFFSSILDASGKWKLQGPFHPTAGWTHYLQQV